MTAKGIDADPNPLRLAIAVFDHRTDDLSVAEPAELYLEACRTRTGIAGQASRMQIPRLPIFP
jgi:hypothetical protein